VLKGISRTLALRIALATLGLLVVLGSLFTWRIMSGGSLGPLGPQLESMINAGLKGIQLRFDDSIIAWSEGRKFAHLQFVGVRVVDENEAVIARVPRANITLSGPALLGGTAAPTEVELIGVSANIVRRAGGGIQLGLQVNSGRKQDKAAEGEDNSQEVVQKVLQAMLHPSDDDTLSKYLKRFAISEAKLSVFDEETRSSWVADNASLTFDRKPNGVAVSIKAPVKLANRQVWQFAASGRYTNGSKAIALEASFKPVRLSVLAANGSGLQSLKGFDIPVAGNLACGMNVSGALGKCKFWLNAGAGKLLLPALRHEPIELKEAAVTAEIDFVTKRYAISEMTWQGKTIRGQITGDGQLGFGSNGELQSLSADWTADNIFMDAPNLFDGGFSLETLKFKGEFDAIAQSLAIEQVMARKGPFELSLTGSLQDHPVSMGVKLTGAVTELSIPDLKRLWPTGSVPGARDWIFANIHEGMVRKADINIDLVPGAIVDDRIPNEMLNVAFQMSGLKVTYLAGLPDLTGVDGTALLNGDTFTGELKSGQIGSIILKKGGILINELHKQGTVGNISGTVTGPTRDILQLIDAPRLKYPSRYGIQADKAGGTSNVDLALAIPMLRDLNASDIGIDVNAELLDVKLPINEKFGLTGGKFSVKLDMNGLKALGAVQINGAPVGFIWNEDFTGTARHGTHIDVTATLTDSQRDVFGLKASPYLEGRTSIVATFTGKSGKIQNATIDANLAGSRLSIPELNWAKPEDATATLKANLAMKPGDVIEISNIDAAGRDIKAQGRLVLTGGKVTEADFGKLELGKRNDFALVFRSAGAVGDTVQVKGKALDAAGLLDSGEDEEPTPAKPAGAKSPLSINAELATLHLQGGVSFGSVKFGYTDDGIHLTQFRLDAMDQNARVRGEMTTAADGTRKLRFETADAGRIVKGVTGFRSLIGGDLKLTAELSPLTQGVRTEAAFDGRLVIEDFKIVDQPFFARLLSAGSFTGLDDLLRGEGITFTRLEQTINGRGPLLTFSDGRAAGPSIGLTMQGTYQRDAEKLDVNGTIVPLYGLNSIFEDVPLVSDILGSRDGEGIFAVTYGVKGEVDELRVAVNPISMLTPGFLRKIFQGAKPDAAAPMPLPMPRQEQKNVLPPAAKPN
jgi:hypothetical protein